MNGLAIVNDSTGKVQTIIRPDLPAGFKAPPGYHLTPADSLPNGWQFEPEAPAPPQTGALAGVTVTAEAGRLTIPARLVIDGGDLQTLDPDRGLVLRDADGHDWLVAVVAGALTAVQISASPEVSHAERKARLAAIRGKVAAEVTTRKGKGKNAKPEDRLALIEALLGISAPAD